MLILMMTIFAAQDNMDGHTYISLNALIMWIPFLVFGQLAY